MSSVNEYPKRLVRIISEPIVLPSEAADEIPIDVNFEELILFKNLQNPINIYSYMVKIPELRGINILSSESFPINCFKEPYVNPADYVFQTTRNYIPAFEYSVPFQFSAVSTRKQSVTDELAVGVGEMNIVLDGRNLNPIYLGSTITVEFYLEVEYSFVEGE